MRIFRCLLEVVSVIEGLRRLLGSSGLLLEGIKLVRLPLFGDQVLRHVVNGTIVKAVWLSLISLGIPHQVLDVVLGLFLFSLELLPGLLPRFELVSRVVIDVESGRVEHTTLGLVSEEVFSAASHVSSHIGEVVLKFVIQHRELLV